MTAIACFHLSNVKNVKCFVYSDSALSYQASLQAHYSNNKKQILQIQHNRLKIPTGRRQSSWLYYKHGPCALIYRLQFSLSKLRHKHRHKHKPTQDLFMLMLVLMLISLRKPALKAQGQTLIYTWDEPNTNEQKLLFFVICIRFVPCKDGRLALT